MMEVKVRKKGAYIYAHYDRAEHRQDILTFKLGNRKLDDSILIFNMPAGRRGTCAHNCPGCYALRDENFRSVVRECRERNLRTFRKMPELFFDAIQAIYYKYSAKIAAFRLHESGDIFSSRYCQAIEAAASWLQRQGIPAYTYTKSMYRPAFINIVESILPDGDVNFGDPEYVQAKAAKHDIPICPATAGHNIKCGRDCTICQFAKHVIFYKH